MITEKERLAFIVRPDLAIYYQWVLSPRIDYFDQSFFVWWLYIASKKSYSRCIVFYILKCFMLTFKIYLLIGILFMTPTFCGAEHPNMWPFSFTCLYVFTIYLLIRILSMTPIFCCKEQHEICGFSFLCVIVVQYIQSVCPFVPSCLFVWQNLHTKLPTKQLENNSHHIFKSASSFRSHHWKNRGKLFQIRQ